MPLFFIIAIGLGAATVGASTVDVTTDMHEQQKAEIAQKHSGFQASNYSNHADCLQGAYQHGLPATACPQG